MTLFCIAAVLLKAGSTGLVNEPRRRLRLITAAHAESHLDAVSLANIVLGNVARRPVAALGKDRRFEHLESLANRLVGVDTEDNFIDASKTLKDFLPLGTRHEGVTLLVNQELVGVQDDNKSVA